MTSAPGRRWTLPPVVSLADLGPLGDRVSGATGQSRAIHRLERHPEWLAKIYRTSGSPNEARRLDGLIAAPWTLDAADRETLLSSSSWPVARITAADGTALGCVLPVADERYRSVLTVGATTVQRYVEADWLAKPAAAIGRVGLPVPTPADRLAACLHLVRLADVLDRLDLVYSDWSYSNAFWSPSHRSLYAIDIDGCRIGKAPNLHQPNWSDPLTPPGTAADRYTDRYRLALLVARCVSGLRDARVFEAIAGTCTALGRPALAEVLLDMVLAGTRDQRPSAGQLRLAAGGGPYVRPVPKPVRVPVPVAPPIDAGAVPAAHPAPLLPQPVAAAVSGVVKPRRRRRRWPVVATGVLLAGLMIGGAVLASLVVH